MSACINTRRERGASLPCRARSGLTAETPSAGNKPKSKVTPKVNASANPRTRQSGGRIKRTGSSGGLILLTTNGAEPQAKNTPSAAASTAIHAASINKLHKTPASGPDGHSRGHLAGARRRSRGHQVGHVRASNQQHQRHQNTQRSKRATPRHPASAEQTPEKRWRRSAVT